MSFINIFSMNKVVLGIVITLFVSILLNFDMNVEANTKKCSQKSYVTTDIIQSQKVSSLKTETGSNSEMVGIAPSERENDKYQSMTQLEDETTEGVDWKKSIRNTGKEILIVAPHGGNIEQGTTELTKALADKGNYDYFSFEAIRPRNNSELHVTSRNYNDLMLNSMIQNRKATISIHGAKGNEKIVYIGGPRSDLRNEIEKELVSRGFNVMVPPDNLSGKDDENFINREKGNTGIQLELTYALRKSFFTNNDVRTKNRTYQYNWTHEMYVFLDALYDGIHNIYPNT